MSTNTVYQLINHKQKKESFSLFSRLLEYFGEIFSSSECKHMISTECDNCRQVVQTSTIDCTKISVDILKLVSDLNQINLTLPYIIDILRGINSKPIRDAGHHRLRAFNSCNQLNRLGKRLHFRWFQLFEGT